MLYQINVHSSGQSEGKPDRIIMYVASFYIKSRYYHSLSGIRSISHLISLGMSLAATLPQQTRSVCSSVLYLSQSISEWINPRNSQSPLEIRVVIITLGQSV